MTDEPRSLSDLIVWRKYLRVSHSLRYENTVDSRDDCSSFIPGLWLLKFQYQIQIKQRYFFCEFLFIYFYFYCLYTSAQTAMKCCSHLERKICRNEFVFFVLIFAQMFYNIHVLCTLYTYSRDGWTNFFFFCFLF